MVHSGMTNPAALNYLLGVAVLALIGLLALSWHLLRHKSRRLRRAYRKLLVATRHTVALRKAMRDALSAYHQLRRRQIGWSDSRHLTHVRTAQTPREVPIPRPPPLPSFVSPDEPDETRESGPRECMGGDRDTPGSPKRH